MDEEPPTEGASLSELQDATLAAITTIRNEIEQLFRVKGHTEPFTQTVAALAHYMSARSQAVCMLTSWSYPWDAEIVLRSFYETWVKVLYLTLSPPEKRDQLVEEFWIDFDSIHSVRRARKAGYAADLRDDDDSSNEVFESLRDPNLWDLSHRQNKAKRKEIEQRWSFSEIIETLSTLNLPGRDLQHMKVILHMYGMASHLTHADKTALELMMDRSTRPEPERSIVEAAQFGRIFSDLAYMWFFCADAIRAAYELPFRDAQAIGHALDEVDRLGRPFARLFQECQKEFYERIRAKRDASTTGSSTNVL